MRRPGDAENTLRLLLHLLRLLRVPAAVVGEPRPLPVQWCLMPSVCCLWLGPCSWLAAPMRALNLLCFNTALPLPPSTLRAAEREVLLAAGKAHLEQLEQQRRLYLKARALSLAQARCTGARPDSLAAARALGAPAVRKHARVDLMRAHPCRTPSASLAARPPVCAG